ncbi:MAG: hypothetical protein QW279_03655, partial [Candidatus Jordarchaeaceae archaeon]
MEQNNTKNKQKLFKGKTKHILLLLPAILILTCILALPLVSGQQIYIPLQTNNVNPRGELPINGNLITTLGNTILIDNNLSFVGNMTINGNSTLNGNLDISNAQSVILGSPLIANGTMTITGDKIELGKPTNSGGLITILGNSTYPAVNMVKGNLILGNITTQREVYFNITNYYQFVNSSGGGVIGDYNNESDDIPLLNSDIIRVHSGLIQIYSASPPSALANWIRIRINHDWCNITMNVFLIGNINTEVHLWGNPSYSNDNYSGKVNVTQFAVNEEFPSILGIDINDLILESGLTPSRYLTLTPGTVFDSWGPWFAVGDSSGAGGVMLLNDTYIYMNSSSSITYRFLQSASNQAAITLTKSTNYPKAEMYVSTRNQSITGLGNSTITIGGISTSGYSDVKNITKITQGTFTFTGNMLVKGNSNIQGNININGYNKLQAPITITGQINVNNGLMSGAITLSLPNGIMETDGTMSITNGEMNITGGTMQMNSTGVFVYGASSTSIKGSITSTGILEITGSPSIQGNMGINGP